MSRLLIFTAAAALLAFAAANPAAQDHGQYTQAEIDAGSRVYNRQCAACHGPNGDQVSGIDLRRQQFRRASSDEDLARVITTGAAGGAMPPFALQPAELTGVGPAEAVRRVQACLKALAAVPVPAKEVR